MQVDCHVVNETASKAAQTGFWGMFHVERGWIETVTNKNLSG